MAYYNNGGNMPARNASGGAMNNRQMQIKQNRGAFEGYISQDNIRNKFKEVLGKNAEAFVASLLSLVKVNDQLAAASPMTVMSAAMTAATLKLPINPNLGFAYIIPYGNVATFQMGYKGYIQLAERTGQYKTINASVVHEGQIEDVDFITGAITRGRRTGDTVIGYVAYIEFLNGFSKTLYMTKAEMDAHARKYSQAYARGRDTVWKSNFDAMALKTVIKLLISKYGIMSIEMESSNLARAIAADQAMVGEDGETFTYVDNQPEIEAQEPPQAANALNMDNMPKMDIPQPQAVPQAVQPNPVVASGQPQPEEECPF